MTKARAALAPEFKKPARARWHCATCGSVVAAILRDEPTTLIYAEYRDVAGTGERGRVLLLRRPLADPCDLGPWCPRCGPGQLTETSIREVMAAMPLDSRVQERSITPLG